MGNIFFSCQYIIVSGTLTFVWVQAWTLEPVGKKWFNFIFAKLRGLHRHAVDKNIEKSAMQ